MYKKLLLLFVIIISIVLSGCAVETPDLTDGPQQIATDGNDNFDGGPTATQDTGTAYKVGDKFIFRDNGVDEYSLTINSVKVTDERNEFAETNPAQVVIIDYSYENLSGNKEVYIFSANFKVFDGNGAIAETYPAGVVKYPQSLPEGAKGTKCENVQEAYGLVNKSTKITLLYFDNMFDSKATATFELEV